MSSVLRFLAVVGVLFSAATGWAKVEVVSTLPDYGAIVRAIGGEHVNVRVLSSPLEDPHYVDAKPSFIVALNRADLLIFNGLELEIGWLPNLIIQSRNSEIQPGQAGSLEVARFVNRLIDVPRGAVDRSMGDIHAGGNPHFHHDPSRMMELLPIIAQRLIQLDPVNKRTYQDNLARTQAQFKELLDQARSLFANLSVSQRQVVAYHKSFGYLFETLGLEVKAYLEPKPGVAPTPAHVAKVLALMKREKIGVIVQEAHYPSRTSATVAKLAQAKMVQVVGGTQEGETYLEHVRDMMTRIYQAISGENS